MIVNHLTDYEVNVLGIELDPLLAIDTHIDGKDPYHRCFIRWGASTGGGTLYAETAKTMTFEFVRTKERNEMHKWIGKHGISCVRLPGNKLLVKLPFVEKFKCCADGGMWPPRKVSLRMRKKKFMSRAERRYWRRKWGSRSEREKLFGSEFEKPAHERRLGRKRRRRRRRR